MLRAAIYSSVSTGLKFNGGSLKFFAKSNELLGLVWNPGLLAVDIVLCMFGFPKLFFILCFECMSRYF